MWLFGLGVAAPVVDTAAGLALGHPLPVTSLAVLALLAALGRPFGATSRPVSNPSASPPLGLHPTREGR